MKVICKRTDNTPLYHFIGSIPGIVIYIFTIGKVWHGHVLIIYTIDGEVNHNQYSTHNRGKSRGKCIYEWCIITNH